LEDSHVLAAGREEPGVIMEELYVCHMTAVSAIYMPCRLGLAAWVGVKVDLAKVIRAGYKLTLVAASAGVNIRTISSFWPDSTDIESEGA